jgi:cell shape-determining protein MreC
VLLLLPRWWLAPLRDSVALLLRPGQRVACAARDFCSLTVRRLQLSATASDRTAQLERDNQSLAARSRQLELALQLAQAESVELREQFGTAPEGSDSLLAARPIEARVLGSQARGWLESRAILDAGATARLAPGALVLEGAATLDLGDDIGIDEGNLVLMGREVWGQVVSVAGWTSMARHVTQSGYRDVVQLAQTSDDRLRLGPRGILEGTGKSLCRIRMVPVTEPVSVGDVVFTAADGAPTAALCYGRVVRIEQPRGADHWEIWMQPAVDSRRLRGTVAVLRTELNPARVERNSFRSGSKRTE